VDCIYLHSLGQLQLENRARKAFESSLHSVAKIVNKGACRHVQPRRYNYLYLPFKNTEYFLYLVYEAIGTAATPALLCQPRVIAKMIVEKQMECRLAGETEVLGENVPQRHFCPSQNPT
jgi:hypothetical protein